MPNENKTGMLNTRNAECSAHGVGMGQNANNGLNAEHWVTLLS